MEFKIGDRVIFTSFASKPVGTIESFQMAGKTKFHYVRFDAPINSKGLLTQYIRARNLELAKRGNDEV